MRNGFTTVGLALLAIALLPACAGEIDSGAAAQDAGDLSAPSPANDLGLEPSDDLPASYLVLRTASMLGEPSAKAERVIEVQRGSRVKPLAEAPHNGYLKVKLLKKKGWIVRKRLAAVPAYATRREVAIAHPDAFFKRQARHPLWNPDGPLKSSNCATASLAMAVMVFGKEPAGLSVERSIDRVRKLMNKPSDLVGANEGQVRDATQKLDLKWTATTKGTLDRNLERGRMVVLTGTPGAPNRRTAYQKAFIDEGYAYTYDGPHSILVMALLGSDTYLVADPLSSVGPIKLKRAALRDFFSRWGGTGTAIWAVE